MDKVHPMYELVYSKEMVPKPLYLLIILYFSFVLWWQALVVNINIFFTEA